MSGTASTQPADFLPVARLVVRDALRPSARVDQLELVQAGPDTVVLTVRLVGRSDAVVLKLAPLDARPRVDLQRTAAAMGLARALGVAVPEVLAADASGRADGWQHLLQRHVAGRTWRELRPGLERTEVDRVHREIAEVLLALRSRPDGGSGEPQPALGPPGPGLLDALHRRARLRVGRPDALLVAEEVLERNAALLAGSSPASLCHDDLHHDNLLLRPGADGWRVAAVLDWDKAWAGPAESDLARVAFWDDMTGPGFWSVYRRTVPVSDGEEERLAVYQLLWCLEYDAPTERHRADTAALARRLGVRPPPDRA